MTTTTTRTIAHDTTGNYNFIIYTCVRLTNGTRTRFCRNQCVTEAEDRSACFKLREDYVECLHHRKEYKRENAIEAERQRKNEEHRVKVTEELLQEMWSFSWVKDEKYAPKPKE